MLGNRTICPRPARGFKRCSFGTETKAEQFRRYTATFNVAEVFFSGFIMSESITSSTPLSIGVVSASATRRAGDIFPIMLAHATQATNIGFDVAVHCVEDAMTKNDRSLWGPVPMVAYRPALHKSFAFAPKMKAGPEQSCNLRTAPSEWRRV